MSVTIHEVSVPVFVRMLRQLAKILNKTAAHAQSAGIESTVLLEGRLRPDMYPLAQQVRIAADAAVDAGAVLAQMEAPRFENAENSIPELLARVDRAVAFLEGLDPSRFEGAEARMVSWTARGQTVSVNGLAYLLNHAMPKFYFHLATAYAILRHDGVGLTKGDFMGKAER